MKTLDCAIFTGPRMHPWPSATAQLLASLCSEKGLIVGIFNSQHLKLTGISPHSENGASILSIDSRQRVHTWNARSVVRFRLPSEMGYPQLEGDLQALLPLSTAERLFKTPQYFPPLEAGVVILGTTNRALRFGCFLIRQRKIGVTCIESTESSGAKNYEGWETEKRIFEILGGKIIHATPIALTFKKPFVWNLKLKESIGVRILETSLILSAGPYDTWDQKCAPIREYPKGSLLFDVEDPQIPQAPEAFLLAAKLTSLLACSLNSDQKKQVASWHKRAKSALKLKMAHKKNPFLPTFSKKWLSDETRQTIQQFSGTPKKEHVLRPIASVECFENISCKICQSVCPESAIFIERSLQNPQLQLLEDRCTGCGICVSACPSSSIPLLYEKSQNFSELTFPHQKTEFEPHEMTQLMSRQGEVLGTGKVISVSANLVTLQVPTYLLWEARGVKKKEKPSLIEEREIAFLENPSNIVPAETMELVLNQEKRIQGLRKPPISISQWFFELGRNRKQDALLCPDGSCHQCLVNVSGQMKRACQIPLEASLTIQTNAAYPSQGPWICPCMELSQDTVIQCLKNNPVESVEGFLALLPFSFSRPSVKNTPSCNGALCETRLLKLLSEHKVKNTHQWIRWSVPQGESEWEIEL